jgi:iron(III) transport system permease protein
MNGQAETAGAALRHLPQRTAGAPWRLYWVLLAACGVLALPVLALAMAWLTPDPAAWATLAHQAGTVLPRYAATSLVLAASVAVGVALVGGLTAVAVSLFEFPLRRFFEWALLLPLAMPAYVLAYAYTDALQFSGPLQTALRAATGAQGALWPDIRSLPGAVLLFVLCLYPYVYLLTRAALAERGVVLMEAARLLGARLSRRVREVALPLARPALAAGVALALMETLADYGVGSYFGLATFTTGIYKAWLAFGDRIAAAQLATLLLAVVAVLVWLERRARSRLRFAAARPASAAAAEARRAVLHGRRAAAAFALCALPLLLGFVLPVLALLRLVGLEAAHGEFGLPWARFGAWAFSSFTLAALSAALAAALALALGFALRDGAPRPLRVGAQIVSLGYAVPGAVIAIGLLLPLGWLQQHWPQLNASAVMTGTVLGLVYAYLVRFSAVALQSVEAGYARVSASVDESARMLGASRARLFARVHLPLLKRSALAAALLVFVDVMKELPATLVLRPFDSDTLAVVAYQLAKDERLAEAALPSLAIVVVGLIPVVMLSAAMRSGRPRAGA